MRKLLLATTAALGLAASVGIANATLTYTIWTGDLGSAFHGATFPVPTTDLLLPSFTDTHDTLNFDDPGPFPTPATFAGFDSLSHVLAPHFAAAGVPLSTVMSTSDSGTDINTLLSGQKANRFSWLAGMALSHLVASDESAVWIGIFSNIVTERTCSNV